ncbi:MAG TPA: hypothetical protein VLD57_00860, partial [Blastocatellia bacterium]|nr:hypothetical protein [Blastocatellia bacterium]
MGLNRFKFGCLIACLLVATSISSETGEAQSKIDIITRLEIRPDQIVNSYQPSMSGAEEKPPFKLVKEPEYYSKKPLYGKLTIGNTKDRSEVVVVIDETEGE